MKSREKRRLARAIRGDIPGGSEAGAHLVVSTPVDQILQAVCLDDSSDPASVYVSVFVLPLYVPAEFVALDFGKRLGGGIRRWTLDEREDLAAAVRDEAIPFLAARSSPVALARSVLEQNPHNPYFVEAQAYSLVRAGDLERGLALLRAFSERFSDDDVPWLEPMRERAKRLASAVETDLKRGGSPTDSQRLLDGWREESIENLGLRHLPGCAPATAN